MHPGASICFQASITLLYSPCFYGILYGFGYLHATYMHLSSLERISTNVLPFFLSIISLRELLASCSADERAGSR
ncbi:hypothetical protein EJ06DRAFT_346000 [Trichodelitschia bisporula]|uniref:Uncharacterized protein n=1 Tax=Trichodelitschia bisporula TaxID=703511 RepID=A0A6G1I2R0_9PEZI|nr:hypothetical protein EJ06DRAFT_346000 [Trichodelitschia bisporula]